MKKLKLCKISLIVISVLLLVIVVIVGRKMIILASLDKKISEYENSKNLYSKVVTSTERVKSQTIETYYKEDKMKYVIETEQKDGSFNKIIQVTNSNERKVFFENEKTVAIYHEDNNVIEEIPKFMNYAKSYTLSERLLNSVFSNIKNKEVEGKRCYEISSLKNSNILYEEGTEKMLIYIEKETALPIKIIQIIHGNEYITNYEYKFDSITEEDMAEPNISEYKII